MRQDSVLTLRKRGWFKKNLTSFMNINYKVKTNKTDLYQYRTHWAPKYSIKMILFFLDLQRFPT